MERELSNRNPAPAGLTRREALAAIGAMAAAGGFPGRAANSAPATATPRAGREPRKVAALLTEFRYRLHSHVILENFLEPYLFRGGRIDSDAKVVSLYVDRPDPDDMTAEIAREYGLQVFPTIREALTLGGRELAVDAVLSLCENGTYPVNAKGQTEYPRKRFFDEILAVFDASGRVAPVFNDKHLSYRWDWASGMARAAAERGVPLMAGSSVPLAERRPPWSAPAGARIVEAVSIHGGPPESYDFHGLEVAQAVLEARAGGETGVADVRFLNREQLWKAADEGAWSVELAEAAMRAELGPDAPPLRKLAESPEFSSPWHGILVNYRDGTRAATLKVGYKGSRWNFACRLDGDPEIHAFHHYGGPWNNRNLFRALAHAIQHFFRTGVAPAPVERTLLTGGILSAAMDSRAEGGTLVETEHLAIAYEPRDFSEFIEDGATWKIIGPDAPEPRGFDKRAREFRRD